MKFGLDYDGTFTEDKQLWARWVKDALDRGHEVCFVTYRRPHQTFDIADDAAALGIRVIYCDYKQKSTVYNADVWIDNQPELIPTLHAVAQWTDK